MKKTIILLLCAFALLFLHGTVKAEDDVSLILEQELGLFDFSGWDYSDTDVSINAKTMIENFLNSQDELNAGTLFDYIKGKVRALLLGKLPLVLFLTAVGIISGIFSSLVPDEKSGLNGMVNFLSCAVCAGAVCATFISVTGEAVAAINRTVTFSECAAPVMGVLLTASGRGATEAVFSPAMAFLTGTVCSILRRVLIPLITAGFIFAVMDALGKSRGGKLLALAKSASKWVCGITTAVFTGALTIYGLGARAHDSLAVKTAKYVADKAIPGMGGLISGAADTVIECANSIKTASGAVFIIIAVVIVSGALFSIIASILALRISAAVTDTLTDSRISALFSNTADMLGILFAAAAAVNVMLIISVAMLTCFL